MPPLSEILMTQFATLVEARLGLSYSTERLGDLEKAARAAAEDFPGATYEEYVLRFLCAEASDEAWKSLAERLTVGETYFFREKPSFAALERHILPDLIAARRAQGSKRLRFWSAGCCTGEEPYSLAILLTRLLPDIADWDVTLLATDINTRFLEKAAEGIYGEWSFRNAPPWLKGRFFRRTPEGRWALLPRIKQMVTLRPLNLASGEYPSSANGARAMDVILCRNVLLYMSPKQTVNVIGRLRETLSDGGWLSVGPAETSAIFFDEFDHATICGATLYRKTPPEPLFSNLLSNLTLPDAAPAPPLPELAASVEEIPVDAALDPLASARACADAGELAQALAWSDRAIAEEKPDAAIYYLRAVILQEQGVREQAGESLRSALMLNPEFVLAHFALGSLARGLGRDAEANEHFLQARALLQTVNPDDVVPESEGIAAGKLLEMIEEMIDRTLTQEPLP